MFDIKKIRQDFPILSRVQGKYPYTYLDSGATAQKPRVVIDAMRGMMENTNSNIHRGVHQLSGMTTVMYEESREVVRSFIGADSVREVIFTSGATMSINLVAYSYGEKYIKKGDVIVVSEMEHHANLLPWQLLCQRKGAVLRMLPFGDDGELMMDKLEDIVSDGVKIVAVTEVSNVLGTSNDIKTISRRAHEVGAIVVVDGCQGVVHGTVGVKELECDFYAFSGHKLYAPTGVGVLWGREELLEEMPPFLGGGDMVKTVTFESSTYAELPLKFEAGTTAYLEAIAMAEGIKYMQGIGIEEIQKHENGILKSATKKLEGIDGVKIYGNSITKSPIISFNVEGLHPFDIGTLLDKMGVAVRTGTHCATPVMTHYGVTGMVRASIAMYTNEEDINCFIDALNRALIMLR